MHLSTYRERGVLRRFRASGMSEWALLGSQFLVGVGTCLVGALAISVLGIFAYGVVVPASIGGVAVAFVVAVFAFSALGVLIASLAPTARAAQGVGLLIWFIMMFISGTSAPLSELPPWMVALAKALPLYHVVISLVDPWNGYGSQRAPAHHRRRHRPGHHAHGGRDLPVGVGRRPRPAEAGRPAGRPPPPAITASGAPRRGAGSRPW